MTDRSSSPLALRLAAAFVAVAVTAVAVLTVLALASARGEVARLVDEVHRADAAAAAAAAGTAYERAGGWAGADLNPVAAVAARGQATIVVAGPGGEVVAAPIDEAARMMASMHGIELVDTPRGEPVSAPVTAGGEQVGTVVLRFPASHLPSPELQLRNALSRTAIVGAGVAVLAAVAVAAFVARQVSRPVAALTTAAARLERGERDVRVGMAGAPGELGALARAFDRMAEAIAREDQLRRRLVHDVAHEVRTPLTILQATTEGLVDGVLPAEAATLASLHEEVTRLGRLVGDLEILAAADAAALTMTTGPVDLADVAAAVVDRSASAAAEAGLTVHLDTAPAPVEGDRRRLIQIATNLVANALRYTPPGGSVSIRTATTGGTGAVLVVEDTGPGLTGEDTAHLFERFYRGSAAGMAEGSGIGLAVAAELAGAHAGTITAENRAGGGARFRVTLPRARG